jgi:hypothetical protein
MRWAVRGIRGEELAEARLRKKDLLPRLGKSEVASVFTDSDAVSRTKLFCVEKIFTFSDFPRAASSGLLPELPGDGVEGAGQIPAIARAGKG